jgi:hypothetical protein
LTLDTPVELKSVIELADSLPRSNTFNYASVFCGIGQSSSGRRMTIYCTRRASDELGELLVKVAEDAELTSAERIRMNLLYANVFDNLAQSYEASVAGLIGEYSYEHYLQSYLSQSACRYWWTEGQMGLPRVFVEHVEQRVLQNLKNTRPHWQPSS